MRWAAVLLVALVTSDSPEPAALVYRVAALSPKVTAERARSPIPVAEGATLAAGDELRTGWRGRVTLAVPTHATHFEIAPNTLVRLASDEPGVLVVVQSGLLRAVFDAFTGRDERLVATPGALLAVRGTRYALRVAPDGEATVAVFSGAVEVLPRQPSLPPATVRQGELCSFGPARAPVRRPLPPTLHEGNWERHQGMTPARHGDPGGSNSTDAPGCSSPSPRRPSGRGRG